MSAPLLRDRLRDADRRLGRPSSVRTLSAVLSGLLVLQLAVVLDRSQATDEVSSLQVAAVPEGLTAQTDPSRTGTDEAPSAVPPAAPPATPVEPPTAVATEEPAALVRLDPGQPSDEGQASARPPATTPRPAGEGTPARPVPSADPSSRPASRPQAEPSPAPEPEPARDTRSAAHKRFDARFPAQAAATQDVRQPATTRWAVLIGVNEHSGRTRDNIGSRQDAEDLRVHLLSLGWRDDHILLVTDRVATRETIVESLAWLARKTDGDSLAVIHYSGHVKQWPGRDVDGDGETLDEALWPTDNKFLTDRDFVTLVNRIPAGRLWIDIGACEAAGLADPGLARDGRLLTFSSKEDEKSYEDPSVGNSVWGYYLVEEGFRSGRGDANGDGEVTVEEAFRYAAPRASERTRGQRKGRQTPVVSDGIRGELSLLIPPPPPEPRPEPSREPRPEPTCELVCPPGERRRA